MTDKKYFVNGSGYLCDMELSNTLSIFECADLLNSQHQKIQLLQKRLAYYEETECSKRLSEMGVQLDFLQAENFDFRNKLDSLKLENNMLRTTIGRNEAHISRLENNSKWSIMAHIEPENHNCEKCHNFDTLIDWNEGIYFKCMAGNNLWEKCKDFDEI